MATFPQPLTNGPHFISFAGSMKINEFEAAVLDTVLGAFGEQGRLDRQQLLELFDGDDELAASMVRLLTEADMIEPEGYNGTSELPERIMPNPKAASFLQEGGFSAQFQQPTAVKPLVKPYKQIPFEIELASEENLIGQDELPETMVEMEQPLHPIIAKAPAVDPVSDTDMQLQAEIAYLRKKQLLIEHKLRDKNILIQSLQTCNNQLAKLRIFIWIQLGMIALLILWLVLRK